MRAATAVAVPAGVAGISRGGVAAAAAILALLWLAGGRIAPWAVAYPAEWTLPAARLVGDFMTWLLKEAAIGPVSFVDMTRFVAVVADIPYRIALSFLSTGLLEGQGSAAVRLLPPLPWAAVIGAAAVAAHYAGGFRLALLVGGCFAFLVAFGQWQSAMVTLASIAVAAPAGFVLGLLLGIAAHRSAAFGRILSPLLDLMQTVPVFAYLVPILFLFGFGPTAAVVATLIYAMPPMTRVTWLALDRVAPEIRELGTMTGCTRRQLMWKVLLPACRDSLAVGVNQVIMLSLNMVIIASMIGAGGLGFDVLAALRRLDIGAGLESGLAIVALAIALDRLTQALAAKSAAPAAAPGRSFAARHRHLAAGAAVVLVAILAARLFPALQDYPETWEISTGRFWSNLVGWINVNYFDTLEALKNAILLNFLLPVKRAMLGLPWLGVAILLAATGWRLGGPRLAALAGGLCFAIAATGQWEKAMITVYLCGASVVVAAAIGIPVGVLAASRERLWNAVEAAIDTLQTLPSFVYLMPAVMLFRVGDFTAMLAVVAFAVAPAIRYTATGLRRVDPGLVEAGRAFGCTPWQLLTRIRLRMALPEILLGINQTIMFALSMLVITALVGTRDLGQEVYIALTKADTGRGIVAGLAVAFIAIIADRLIAAGARRARERLGIA
jgi:glycine betaine/proline transport system permease protein